MASIELGTVPPTHPTRGRPKQHRRPTARPRAAHSDTKASSKKPRDKGKSTAASTGLPLPATASPASAKEKKAKSARIDGGGLRVHWARFKQRLGTGSAFSESLLDGGGESTDTSLSYRRGIRDRDKDRTRDRDRDRDDPEPEENEEVDEVVVDNELGEKASLTQPSEHGSNANEKSGGGGSQPTTTESSATNHTYGIWESSMVLTFLRWRIWPSLVSFFTLRFFEDKTELQYRKETWSTSKSLAIYSGLFLILNWVLVAALGVRPFSVSDKIFYYGIGALISVPLPFMAIYDMPVSHPMLYQIYLLFAVWTWSIYLVCFIYSCGFYGQGPHPHTCGNRDFLGLFYYTIGLPTVGMFGLRQTRFANLLGAVLFIILNAVLIAPFHTPWIRNIVNAAVFHLFLLYIHYKRETSERRLYSLRDQLKVQFRATQQAQVNERKAADSKRRLTSYVFHEVRVPLNTALLAVQNLDATGNVVRDQDIEWAALGGSLSMMSKVLNDVLDFNRLDSGRFSTVNQPYNLHQAIRSMLVPLRLAADARGLNLQIELDKSIDEVARRAAYAAQGRPETWIEDQFAANTDEDGIVVGDEMRLRQIVTNLASNACKFTPAGGHIKVVTRLIHPTMPVRAPTPGGSRDAPDGDADAKADDADGAKADDADGAHGGEIALSATHLDRHNSIQSCAANLNQIAVRIEVHDTGAGIRAKDLVDNRLFSPYVQTEIGKYQGGKGTGLGLALVRRIVKLSGGRLGVKSKMGSGSQFWVEIPLGVGEKAIADGSTKSMFQDHARSDYSGEFNRDKAAGFRLGLEEPGDFLRPEGEGSTPSTLVEARHTSLTSMTPQADSALKTIMEQRGLFELKSRMSMDDNLPPILSRALSRPPPNAQPPPPDDLDIQAQPSRDVEVDLAPPSNAASPPPNATSDPLIGSRPPPNGSSSATQPSLPPPVYQRDTHTSSSSTQPAEKALRVLVVDDDALTRKLMSRMLGRLGCAVDTAENGKLALDKILGAADADGEGCAVHGSGPSCRTTPGNDNFDIVFLDNQMPVMSGLDTVSALRRRGRNDLVIGVTGNALLSDQQEYLDVGVDRVLTKPVFERSLKMMLQLATERRKESEGAHPPS